ncbi:UNVERIFIED_CONTAM: hypothetical protein NY603_27655, partial [Bacteroidetes bacterium 56_B9]
DRKPKPFLAHLQDVQQHYQLQQLPSGNRLPDYPDRNGRRTLPELPSQHRDMPMRGSCAASSSRHFRLG